MNLRSLREELAAARARAEMVDRPVTARHYVVLHGIVVDLEDYGCTVVHVDEEGSRWFVDLDVAYEVIEDMAEGIWWGTFDYLREEWCEKVFRMEFERRIRALGAERGVLS